MRVNEKSRGVTVAELAPGNVFRYSPPTGGPAFLLMKVSGIDLPGGDKETHVVNIRTGWVGNLWDTTEVSPVLGSFQED